MLVLEKMKFTVEDLQNALGVKAVLGGKPVAVIETAGFTSISTDSRSVEKDALFFALKGDQHDAHDFIGQAIANGAAGVVVSRDIQAAGAIVFKVEDTLRALGDLAAYVRSEHDIDCIAITGSNGKTTTKEFMAACLETKFKTIKTMGNYNNLIGLPLSLARLDDSYEAGVFELGMSELGEISRLAEICKPRIGAFTNIAPVHLESLGTIEAVAKAKYELVESLPADGVVILNADDPIMSGWLESISLHAVTYSIASESNFRANNCRILPDGRSAFELNGVEYRINFPGRHNIYNAICAIAAASVMGIAPEKLVEPLARMKPYHLRSEVFTAAGVTFINDCYNANPVSVKAAIDVLGDFETRGRRVAVLGDMLELGENEREYHQEIGEYLQTKKINALFAVGELAVNYLKKIKGEFKAHYPGKTELISALKDYLRPGDTVLIKGSRRIALEDVSENLKETG